MMTIKAWLAVWGKMLIISTAGAIAAFLIRGEYTKKSALQLLGSVLVAGMASGLAGGFIPESLPEMARDSATGVIGALTFAVMIRIGAGKISVKAFGLEFESSATEPGAVPVKLETKND